MACHDSSWVICIANHHAASIAAITVATASSRARMMGMAYPPTVKLRGTWGACQWGSEGVLLFLSIRIQLWQPFLPLCISIRQLLLILNLQCPFDHHISSTVIFRMGLGWSTCHVSAGGQRACSNPSVTALCIPSANSLNANSGAIMLRSFLAFIAGFVVSK